VLFVALTLLASMVTASSNLAAPWSAVLQIGTLVP
jgi:hypothetical protein